MTACTKKPPLSLSPPTSLSGLLHVVLHCADVLPHAARSKTNSPAFVAGARWLLRFPHRQAWSLSQNSITSSNIGGTSLLPPWPIVLWRVFIRLAVPSPVWRGVSIHLPHSPTGFRGLITPPAHCSRTPHFGLFPLPAAVLCRSLHL